MDSLSTDSRLILQKSRANFESPSHSKDMWTDKEKWIIDKPWGQTLVQISLSTSVFMLPPWVQCTVALTNSLQYIRSCALNQMKKDELDYRVEAFFRLLGSLALWKAGIIVICSHFVIIWLSLPLSLKRKKPLHFISQASILLSQRKWWTYGDSDAVTDESISCSVKFFFLLHLRIFSIFAKLSGSWGLMKGWN